MPPVPKAYVISGTLRNPYPEPRGYTSFGFDNINVTNTNTGGLYSPIERHSPSKGKREVKGTKCSRAGEASCGAHPVDQKPEASRVIPIGTLKVTPFTQKICD